MALGLLSCVVLALIWYVSSKNNPQHKPLSIQKLEYRISYVKAKAKATIITAANTKYYEGVKNLIGSIHFWDPGRDIVVYNLGLSKEQLDELSEMCRVTVNWPGGIPAYIPQHANYLKQYAWKPFVIKDAVDRYDKILWVDGGSDIRGPLDRIDEDLERDSFFIVGNGHFFRSCSYLLHEGMYKYLNLEKSKFLNKEVFFGTYQGYIKGRPGYFRILEPLLQCAAEEKCISPPGSSLSNHRYDQSALSLMVHTSGLNVSNAQKHYDLESWERDFFENDHTVASERILHTGRQKHPDYISFIRTKTLSVDCRLFHNGSTLACLCAEGDLWQRNF